MSGPPISKPPKRHSFQSKNKNTMQVVHTITDLKRALNGRSNRVLVPTMGNLHEGHLSLVRKAQTLGDTTIATIFVNRLQFLPHEDFAAYPRTLEADIALLEKEGCDILFAPNENELYPLPQTFKVKPNPALADILEGEFRPGFFTGVCTVVMKLFACTQPQVAVFGQKDYQQLLIIRQMVSQFALPIDIMGLPTQRSDDGLALSSRNRYLAPQTRVQALDLYHALRAMVEKAQHGACNWSELEAHAIESLQVKGWQPDYLTIRQQCDLAPPLLGNNGQAKLSALVALGAAKIGNVRLIDNIEFNLAAKAL